MKGAIFPQFPKRCQPGEDTSTWREKGHSCAHLLRMRPRPALISSCRRMWLTDRAPCCFPVPTLTGPGSCQAPAARHWTVFQRARRPAPTTRRRVTPPLAPRRGPSPLVRHTYPSSHAHLSFTIAMFSSILFFPMASPSTPRPPSAGWAFADVSADGQRMSCKAPSFSFKTGAKNATRALLACLQTGAGSLAGRCGPACRAG